MIMPIIILVLALIVNSVKPTRIGLIQNISLIAPGAPAILFFGSCDQCLCTIVNSNQTIVSLNCYKNNGTCQFFKSYSQSVLGRLQDNVNTTFYFLQLPPEPISSLFWPFDGSINDASNLVNTKQNGSISFISPGIYGRGSAITFNRSNYLFFSSPLLDLSSNGFTFEMWIYFNFFSPNVLRYQELVGQCLSKSAGNCLHLAIKYNYTYLGFYQYDCAGSRILFIHNWYHIAFVYNVTGIRQLIYINGQLDRNYANIALNYLGNVPLTIGTIIERTIDRGYYGYLDQLSYSNRPKYASEILDDATLVFCFTLNNGSFLDSGPNVMIGTPNNVVLINDSLLFNQTLLSFDIETFAFPSIYNSSYSIALWVNPFSTNGSTIVHIIFTSLCWDMIGFNNQGRIISQTPYNETVIGPLLTLNVWTHIVQTYSLTNGLKLYINGTFFNRTVSVGYQTSNQTYTITLGNCSQSCQTCGTGAIGGTSYSGLLDEFRVYARELNSADIQILAIR